MQNFGLYLSAWELLFFIGTVFFILVIVLLILLSPFIRYSTTVSGEHVGYISAIDHRGLFVKNYVVYFKTDNQSSQEDTYCINEKNKDLIDVAKIANKSRKLVTIEYQGVTGFGLSLCEGEEIYSIK